MVDLPYLASRIFDTPLMIAGRKADTILSAISSRVLDGSTVQMAKPRSTGANTRPGYLIGGGTGVAVLPIIGTLVRRGSWLDAESGLMSYHTICDAVSNLLMDTSVRGLMLEIDSPGGEANGCMDCADYIAKASDATGKPIWAHANECATSAAYAIAAAADQIWLPTTGEVGSIGVLAAHIDHSAADRKAGHRWTYVHAGEEKIDGNPHEPLSDRARDTIQGDVDRLYKLFVEQVADYRGMSEGAVRNTRARLYFGGDAIKAGLADKLGTFDEAVAGLCAKVAK